jgi:hypothetical protein
MKPTVIEQTGKKYKGLMLLGLVICCVSVVLMVSGSYPVSGPVGMLMGLAVYFAARIGAWWNHS